MIDLATIRVGDKVHYRPAHYKNDEFENGIVKEVPSCGKGLRVVYHCDGNWERFEDYTSAMTRLEDLKLGWRY